MYQKLIDYELYTSIDSRRYINKKHIANFRLVKKLGVKIRQELIWLSFAIHLFKYYRQLSNTPNTYLHAINVVTYIL